MSSDPNFYFPPGMTMDGQKQWLMNMIEHTNEYVNSPYIFDVIDFSEFLELHFRLFIKGDKTTIDSLFDVYDKYKTSWSHKTVVINIMSAFKNTPHREYIIRRLIGYYYDLGYDDEVLAMDLGTTLCDLSCNPPGYYRGNTSIIAVLLDMIQKYSKKLGDVRSILRMCCHMQTYLIDQHHAQIIIFTIDEYLQNYPDTNDEDYQDIEKICNELKKQYKTKRQK